ncbi:hypothetical protein C8Q79DRAFT_193960 [Trametes meyenii]|nr:hypothetical protein C8Q79DRAFT_193960 [Trametes meyenii]
MKSYLTSTLRTLNHHPEYWQDNAESEPPCSAGVWRELEVAPRKTRLRPVRTRLSLYARHKDDGGLSDERENASESVQRITGTLHHHHASVATVRTRRSRAAFTLPYSSSRSPCRSTGLCQPSGRSASSEALAYFEPPRCRPCEPRGSRVPSVDSVTNGDTGLGVVMQTYVEPNVSALAACHGRRYGCMLDDNRADQRDTQRSASVVAVPEVERRLLQ